MKRKTKRVLGVLGLAAVMVMTAIACAIPAPDAHAEEEKTDTNNVTIQVTVTGVGSKMNIIQPKNDEEWRSNIVPVSYTFRRMRSVETYMSCTTTSGAEIEQVVDTYNDIETESGTRSFEVDLNRLGVQGDATCRVYLTGKTVDDTEVLDDGGVSFTYQAIKIDMGDKEDEEGKPTTDEKGDPEVTIGISDKVYSLLLQVYDADGNPVFVKATDDGKVEEPILVSRDEFDLESGNYTLNLPMSKYGAKTGWYELVAIAYGEDGQEVVSMNVYRFYYEPETPDVPGTGAIMENLNISKTDYIATGLIAFGAVAVFGVYLVARKSRR